MKNQCYQCYNTINKSEVEKYDKINTKLAPKRKGMILQTKLTAQNKARSKGKKSLF